MKPITEATSQKIKNMSLLCAFLVVSIHVGWPSDVPLSAGWFVDQAITEGIARIAVPFFFIVSGFFLAQHFTEEDWWGREVKKRVRSLVVPFVAWSLIAFVAVAPLSVIADLIAHRPFGTSLFFLHENNWMRILGFDCTDFPLHVPLWYVRCLFFFVLTGGLFKFGVGASQHLWLALTFAACLLANHLPCENVREFFRMGYSLAGVFYFSVGVFIQRFSPSLRSTHAAVLCGLVGMALLAVKLLFAYHGWRFQIALGKLSLPFLIYFTWHFMSARRLPNWLTACSFPIFLMHSIFLTYLGIMLNRLPLGALTTTGIQYIGSILLSIALTLLLRRLSPRAARVLFGGR